jgi:PleD family two-component response regulator
VPNLEAQLEVASTSSSGAEGPGGGRLLVIGSELWWLHSIRSLFEPFGYRVHGTSSGRAAIQQISTSPPDAVILHTRIDGIAAVDLVSSLRAAGLGREHPVLLVAEEPFRRELRLDAFRAGVWDCLTAPLNGEELLLKMESYLGATRVARAARELLFLDEASGLYNARGIHRWARELAQSARRHHRALGCAVIAPAYSADGASREEADQALVQAVVDRLVREGRTSDIIGRLGPSEFVVLATDTGPDGVLTMASRLVRSGPKPAGGAEGPAGSVHLRAGCFAVDDASADPLEPEELIGRAARALHAAQINASDDPTFFSN